MLTGSVPSTAMIEESALRKATYGPFAPIAPRPTSTLGCGSERDQLRAPGIVAPAVAADRAGVEHAVAVDGDRRSRVVEGPNAGVVAPLDDLDLLAAEVAVRLGHELRAVADAQVVPAHARLAHPGLDVLDVLVEVLVDVAMDGVPVHLQCSPSSMCVASLMAARSSWLNRGSISRASLAIRYFTSGSISSSIHAKTVAYSLCSMLMLSDDSATKLLVIGF